MWIAHYASGLAAKPFASVVPLSVLTLAGALPDVVFFILQFSGIETFNLDPSLQRRGCFPYSNEYPYSHSLLGMTVAGVILAVLYKRSTNAPVTWKDQAAIVAASASHFLLEWPSHRSDVKITPGDDTALGAGLFDHPTATFFTEIAIFLAGLWVYATFSPPSTKAGYKRSPNRLWGIVLFLIGAQAHFSFGSAPTTETRWVHAPLFLGQVLASCWLLGKLES
ncbi:hypothetical protein DICSQDRAFT_47628 [Dichomitus squalens LYAD-421 SS1]|uniref:Uncharacterized protein n=1 Tax=Dichomitus squalens TaxID=114155 RepID=A0A4Q9N354_9APHY|nr:uncharacterized protein DICSQDRAFT_47628 [Dichomitus squalens LYAD-421 SS1]EJF67143.1 hypothetical protein DICSQDRAFT_47628 [Dichomitus squalens LYAD-421 SS1]TBU34397.1 hypothetical protein BD311DRAFT_709868 [Dichomitus squalens]